MFLRKIRYNDTYNFWDPNICFREPNGTKLMDVQISRPVLFGIWKENKKHSFVYALNIRLIIQWIGIRNFAPPHPHVPPQNCQPL